MAWIRLDDQIAHHPKLTKCSPSACWLYVTCIAFSQKFLTDGFIPKESIVTLGHVRRPQQCVNELVANRLLEVVSGGYQIHDYLVYNSSASEIRADREWDRFRKELYANKPLVEAIKKRDRNLCRYCGVEVNWNDRRGPHGGQFDHVKPRGPNTFENIVVACRKCNCAKNSRTPEEADMPLRPSSEPERNQVGTSSDLDLRARASYPSHPILEEDPKTVGVNRNAFSPPNGGNGHEQAQSKSLEKPEIWDGRCRRCRYSQHHAGNLHEPAHHQRRLGPLDIAPTPSAR